MSDVRGLLTAIESRTSSTLLAGRFLAMIGAASRLADRGRSFFEGGRARMRFSVLECLRPHFSVTMKRSCPFLSLSLSLFLSLSLVLTLICSSSSSSALLSSLLDLLLTAGSGSRAAFVAVGVSLKRANSSSRAGGSVGDRSAGIFCGDLSFLDRTGAGGAVLVGFCWTDRGGSSMPSLLLLSVGCESASSMGKCRGDSNGGTVDLLGGASRLLNDVLFIVLELERWPLRESPLGRPEGVELCCEPIVDLRMALPFGSVDGVPIFGSLDAVLSCDDCGSFRLGLSSRGVRERSSKGAFASIGGFLGNRASASASCCRLRFSGDVVVSWLECPLASSL